MFDPRILGAALSKAGLDVDRQVTILADIMQNSDSPFAKMAAYKLIREAVIEALQAQGLVHSLKGMRITERDGVTTREEIEASNLLRQAAVVHERLEEDMGDENGRVEQDGDDGHRPPTAGSGGLARG